MTDGPARDPGSVAGKAPRPARHVPLVVVGAGPAGLAAATSAAELGVQVLLIDEHPLDFDLMAMDVPLHFGQRMAPSARNRPLMLERMVEASPALADADRLGVEVLLGVSVWGAFRPGPTVRALEASLVGLADARRSWLVGYDRLILATGARDLALGFPGWTMAGVMGAQGAHALLTRYGALGGRRLVVLGSGTLGLRTALLALARGIEVPAIVEVLPEVQGPARLREAVERQGTTCYTRHAVLGAEGETGEVERLRIVAVDDRLEPVPGTETEIRCDTVCLALGAVPQVELLDVLGCRLVHEPALGGWVPLVDQRLTTSLPDVFVAGDVAGVSESWVDDPEHSRAQGALVGIEAAASLGAAAATRPPHGAAMDPPSRDPAGYGRAWLRSLVGAGPDVTVCQCEEVTRRELLAVAPPRYLGRPSPRMAARDLGTLRADGPLNQDQLKRLTRVGMGPCQGRRCREQVALLLAEAAGVATSAIPLASHRPPVRPLPLGVLWPEDEPEAIRQHWVTWFGIPTQFAPHWERAPDGTGAAPPRPRAERAPT